MKVDVINISNNKLPQYETAKSAGMDIRADFSRVTPENPIKVYGDGEIIFKGEGHPITMFRLGVGSRALIPTGIFTAIPDGYEVQLRPRSGLAIKSGILAHVGTLDAGFRGEACAILYNNSDEPFYIKQGDRIAQGVINEITHAEFNESNNLEDSDRGKDGFGSSGIQ